MSIQIKEVRSKRDLKKFINFATELYAGNPYYCPPLVFDELKTFNPKHNPTLEFAEFICFLAYKEDKIVGRITGIINNLSNEAWNFKRIRFGWFDFIDDLEVSHALLSAVQQWGKEKGMTEMNGPLGFADFDHEGLLLEGYEYNSPMASLYNYPYYTKHYDAFGLRKEADWIEFRIFIPDSVPEKMQRISELVMERYKLKIDKVRSSKELMKKYGYSYFDVIDAAYQPLYNYQPLTQKQKEHYSKMYFPLLNFDFLTIVTNELDEIVGIGVGMPDISEALRKCKGRLFPFGWYHVLKALKTKKIDYFDLLIIAVRPDYQNKGVNALFFYDQIKYFIQYGVQYSETTSILETNAKNQANWEYFERIQHKRRRCYVHEL